MFKGEFMIHIDSGWIYNNNLVYLDLSDLNMLHDLGNILDFYRNINREGKTYRIKLFGGGLVYEGHKSSKRPFCIKCSSLSDELYINNECIKCYNFYENKDTFVNYSKPVIARFNLYEWIPIKGYLENRNIKSHLYKRKLMISYVEDYIHLKLIDRDINTDEYSKDSVILLDKIYRIFSMFNVPSTLEKTMIDSSISIKDKFRVSGKELRDLVVLKN